MKLANCLSGGVFALFGLISASSATTLYSINWLSSPQPCSPDIQSPLHGPIVSTYYPVCHYPGFVDTPLSICPHQTVGQPWDEGSAIFIVGYHVAVIPSSPDAKVIVEIGTASHYGGADVFATVSGTGTFTGKEWFPRDMGVPTGGDRSRIDVYASCGGQGTFAILATIFYTIPEK